MHHVEIKVVNTSDNPTPEYATAGSAGMDLRAWLPEPVILKPMERKLIPTGLFLEIPEGYEVQVRPRSGMAINHGITCLNSPGTVDSDYRGEIKIILVNLSAEPHTINSGERIAQMIVAKVEKAILKTVDKVQATTRGTGGFGHTGKA
ncbi:dUTP diphosphatase [Hanamia caeni]|jgi:dUTP pyrophosphatase|uniref:Deoxyuridine 5'-triphosphate nucleotidohydrolase n=1 Tax=Hanamia caeni TaxID=2294116 RepID=A0A3M9NJM4_9BACT|nr:dUTP diphosphatase [Hanamia caeni]RNI37393.1 dUTP diphosphatase [Hanamia caeni]